jgi:hypothetical protein
LPSICVGAAHLRRNILAAKCHVELAIYIGDGDVVTADRGCSVGAGGQRGVAESGDQISEHAQADDAEQSSHGDLDPAVTLLVTVLNAFQHSWLSPFRLAKP